MIKQFLADQIANLKDGQKVRVAVNRNYIIKSGIITGRVHKKDFGEKYFFIQPVNDSHPGAAITAQDISEVIEIVNE